MLRLIIITVIATVQIPIPSRADDDALRGPDYPTPEYYTSLKPASLAVVIGILAVMFVLTFLLLVYAKFCHRRSPAPDRNAAAAEGERNPAAISSSERFSGLDKTVVESLPFFRFSTLKGRKEGLECAVCLSRFADVEFLRMLPKCSHAFHVACIDRWLEKHASCPLCRRRVGSDDLIREEDEIEEDYLELFVRREDENFSSSRFSIGSSFRNNDVKIDHRPDDGAERDESDDQSKPIRTMMNNSRRWSDVAGSSRAELLSFSAQQRSVSEITTVPRTEPRHNQLRLLQTQSLDV